MKGEAGGGLPTATSPDNDTTPHGRFGTRGGILVLGDRGE